MTPSRPVPSGEETRAQPEAAAQANDHREGVRTGEDGGRQPSPLLMTRNGAASVTAKVNTAEHGAKETPEKAGWPAFLSGRQRRPVEAALPSGSCKRTQLRGGAEGMPEYRVGGEVTLTVLSLHHTYGSVYGASSTTLELPVQFLQ